MVHDRITIDPKVMFGKPVIKGTRVPVELILRKIAEGMTDQQILAHHPHLTVEDSRPAARAPPGRIALASAPRCLGRTQGPISGFASRADRAVTGCLPPWSMTVPSCAFRSNERGHKVECPRGAPFFSLLLCRPHRYA